MPQAVKAVCKWIGIALGLTVLLLWSALLYLQSDHARLLLLNIVNRNIPGTLACRELHLSLLRGEIEIRGAALHGPSTDSAAEEIAAIDRLRIDLAWPEILNGSLHVKSLLMEQPRARLRVNAEGRFNLPAALSDEAPPASMPEPSDASRSAFPLNIVVRDFQLRKGALHYNSTPQNLRVGIEGIDVRADADLGKQSATLALDIARIMATGDNFKTPAAHLQLKTGMQAGTTEALLCRLSTADSRLQLTGTLKDVFTQPVMTLQLDLDASATDIQKSLQREDEWSGRFTGTLTAAGEARNPSASLSLRYSGGKLGGYAIDGLTAALRLQDKLATLTALEAHGANLRLSAGGRLDLNSHEMAATLNLNTAGTQPLLAAFGIRDLKGRLNADAELAGSLEQPIAICRLQGDDLAFQNITIGSVRLNAGMDTSGILKLSSLKLENRQSMLELSASAKLLSPGALGMRQKPQIDLTIREGTLFLEDFLPGFKGRMTLSGRLQGALMNPGGRLHIAGQNVEVSRHRIGDIRAQISLKERNLHFSARQNFELNGVYDLGSKDLSGVLTFDKTRLEPYFVIADQPDLGGTLSGRIELQGNAGAIRQIRADAEFSELHLRHKEREVLSAKPFQLKLRDQTLFMADLELTLLRTGQLRISGSGGMEGALDLRIKGRLPLKALELVSEDITDVRGDIHLAARIQGTLAQPDLQAELELANIGATLPATRQTLHKINGRIRITPQTVRIEGIEGMLDSGRFEISGTVTLEQLQPTRIDLNAAAFALPLGLPDTLQMLINSRLKFEGRPEQTQLSGEVLILEGAYTKDIDLSPLGMLEPRKRETAPAPSEIRLPFLKNLKLDITVKQRQPFQIDNNLAQLEVIPDLRVSGTLNQPVVSGRAAVVSGGTLIYRKKNFSVQKGVIDFVSPYRIEPRIDIESQTTVRSWNIFMTLSGTPEALEFKLRSEPEESNEDILSLLLFGRTTGELIKNEGGLTQSSEQMLADFIAAAFGEQIRQTMGIDILEIDTAANGSAASDRIAVTIGKELSRRMTVKYAVESKQGDIIQRAIAEYKLLEHILLRGSQDSLGAFAGSLLYRLEFR